MLFEHERNYGLGVDALVAVCSLEHERNYGLGMHALVVECSWNTNGIEKRQVSSSKCARAESLGAKLGHGQLHCTDAGRATA